MKTLDRLIYKAWFRFVLGFVLGAASSGFAYFVYCIIKWDFPDISNQWFRGVLLMCIGMGTMFTWFRVDDEC